MLTSSRFLGLFVLAAALGGCGDDDGTPDANASTDGGISMDARSSVDGGGGPDAGVDAATADAGGDAGPDAGTDAGSEGPFFYPMDRLHSPITAELASGLVDRVAPDRTSNVFAKVGDSITVSTNYLRCFGGTRHDLGGRSLEETRAFYDGGDAAGTDPFQRESGAATVGWHAGRAIAGSPSPLDAELSALRPSAATVMFGTNDIGITGLDGFAENLYDVVDIILASGAVPIMSSIPAREDDAGANADVPRFNLVARAIAQTRQVPFVDLHAALAPLPNSGLGGDDLHPSAFSGGACVLTDEALRFGYNVRNLVMLESLDRTRRALGGASLDTDAQRIRGGGTHDDPFVVDTLPYAHGEDTMASSERVFDFYDGCAATQNESGPERVYRLDLAAPTRVRARVFDRGSVDVDIHILSALNTAACVARDHNEAEAMLPAGTAYIVVDSWVGDAERGGEYLLIVESR